MAEYILTQTEHSTVLLAPDQDAQIVFDGPDECSQVDLIIGLLKGEGHQIWSPSEANYL